MPLYLLQLQPYNLLLIVLINHKILSQDIQYKLVFKNTKHLHLFLMVEIYTNNLQSNLLRISI